MRPSSASRSPFLRIRRQPRAGWGPGAAGLLLRVLLASFLPIATHAEPTPPAAGDPPGPAAALTRAEAAAAEGDYGRAFRLAEKLLEAAPDSAAAARAGERMADWLLEAAAAEDADRLARAGILYRTARSLADRRAFAEARQVLAEAEAVLPTGAAERREALAALRRWTYLEEAARLLARGEPAGARSALTAYAEDPSPDPGRQARAARLREELRLPENRDIAAIRPEFVEQEQAVADLLQQARALDLAGDAEGARRIYTQVEIRDPTNPEAKAFLYEIARRGTAAATLDREKTRQEMLEEVGRAWQRPRVYGAEPREGEEVDSASGALVERLESIVLPRVNFSGADLLHVIDSLSELSVAFDPREEGVNLVATRAIDPSETVHFQVRNLSLARVLDLVAEQTGYEWQVVEGVVQFGPRTSRGSRSLRRAILPVSKGTLDLIAGFQEGASPGRGESIPVDPFAAPGGGSGGDGPGLGSAGEASAAGIRRFFEESGISFESVPGSSLAVRGTRLLVHQTPRNLEAIRATLRELDVTDQVEIEAKFMEVRQGALEELGVSWRGTTNADGTLVTAGRLTDGTGEPVTARGDSFVQSPTRLETVFGETPGDERGRIVTSSETITTDADGNETITTQPNDPITFSVAPGAPLNSLDLAADTLSDAFLSGVMGSLQVDVLIRALERTEGSDLLSAPKVTVMSGKTASIRVSQEFRYPQRYEAPEISEPAGDGNASSIGIASGLPRDFAVQDLGVVMDVTPTVEANDNINLSLEPTVTEFEGYVSYGGPNIAVAGDQVVQSPSGYFQPVFSQRQVSTEVTLYDGATVVLGGLTREQVESFEERVPLLGDIPLLGRLFRSQGETSQKRNLLIFVTANRISPGGAPANESIGTTRANALFQNPVLVSPGGALQRRGEGE